MGCPFHGLDVAPARKMTHLAQSGASGKTRSSTKCDDVRFGSKADIYSALGHVRFTPNSDRESGLPQTVMSALPPKADMCGATGDVRYGPKADIRFYRSERAYSGARPLRSGMSEILIRPLNGSFSSKIK